MFMYSHTSVMFKVMLVSCRVGTGIQEPCTLRDHKQLWAPNNVSETRLYAVYSLALLNSESHFCSSAFHFLLQKILKFEICKWHICYRQIQTYYTIIDYWKESYTDCYLVCWSMCYSIFWSLCVFVCCSVCYSICCVLLLFRLLFYLLFYLLFCMFS